MLEKKYRVRTPLFPTYTEIKLLIKILEGEKSNLLLQMINEIKAQTGTPQNPVDWSLPDEWIDERLLSESKRLAKKIWQESHKRVNPRHVYGSYLFNKRHKLLLENSEGLFEIDIRGEKFLEDDLHILQEIDFIEGVDYLLKILGEYPNGKPADFTTEWTVYLKEHSKFGTKGTIQDTMRRRLRSLLDRGLVTNIGGRYLLTKEGEQYLKTLSFENIDPSVNLLALINRHNKDEEEKFKSFLHQMDPYRFEHLVKELLEAIGYEDVEVTKASGDKGVDVVGKVQVGITEITEVVQVKRMSSNINRMTIDQLRGALPYHKAIRGTIITLSDFSKGCADAAFFPGAAPITLINGKKLLELLIKNDIGVKKQHIELVEFDDSFFSESEEDSDDL